MPKSLVDPGLMIVEKLVGAGPETNTLKKSEHKLYQSFPGIPFLDH